MATYELSKDEEAVVLKMRMTPAEIDAADKKQRDNEEEQLQTRLSPTEYADVLAQRAKFAAMTDSEKRVESLVQLQKIIADACEVPEVVAAIQAKVDKSELAVDSMIAVHVDAKPKPMSINTEPVEE